MRRIVDLTWPIEEHWRYGFHVTPVKTHANHDPWQCMSYNLESHWYTHIDAPLHFDPNGEGLDDYPIQPSPPRCWKRPMSLTRTVTSTAC